MKRNRRPVGLSVIAIFVAATFLLACSAPAAPAPTTAPAAPAPTIAPAAPAPTIAPAAPAPTTAPAPAAKAPAGPTGELRVAVSVFGGGALDPQITTPTAAKTIGATIFDPLIGVTPDGKFGPGLAERWEMSPDGKTWTFYLRKGVKFHDGSDLTAADVKFSIERILDKGALSPNAASIRNVVAGADQKDDYTVVVRLKTPDSELLKWLTVSGNATEGLIVPKKYIETKGVEEFRKAPIGSGPWKLVKYENNIELQLESVENHWRGAPKFKKLTIKNIGEESTRLAMLKTGELDLVEITPAKVPEVKSAGLRVMASPGSGQAVLILIQDIQNPKANAVGDVRVRKALSLAINRQEIADTLFSGFATPAPVAGVATSSPYVDTSTMKPDPFDPTEAKRLLAEAGFGSGLTMKMFASGQAIWGDLMTQIISGYWEKVGVKTNIVTQDYAALRPLLRDSSPQVKGSGVVLRFAPGQHFGLRLTAHSKESLFKNHTSAEVDSLLERADATVDPAEKKKVGIQAGQALMKDYSNIGILDVAELFAAGKGAGDWQPIKNAFIPALEFEKIPNAK